MSHELTIESFKKAYLTIGFLAINIILYIVLNVILGGEYVLLLAQDNAKILESNEVWRLVTGMFVHANVGHLANNMFGLIMFGTALEDWLKKWQYFIVYIISGLIGNIFQLLLTPPNSIGLGASGAIFGLMGAVYIFTYKENRFVLIYGSIYLVIYIYSSFAPGVGTWAHIFGLIGGVVLGSIFKKYSNSNNNRDLRKPKSSYRY
jgi:rhomboid protease GluP